MENRGVRINMAKGGIADDGRGKYMFLVRAKEGVIERYVPFDYYES